MGLEIQNSINSALSTTASIAAVNKHFRNQKEANLEAATSRLDQAKAIQKAGEFETQMHEETVKKAESEFNAATEKQNELQGNLNKAQESYNKTQKLAYDYDDQANMFLEDWRNEKNPRKKGIFREEFEKNQTLRDETRAQLKEKGYDISKAREALDNQIQVAKGKEFIFNQAKIRREELKAKNRLNSENTTKAMARYYTAGGK